VSGRWPGKTVHKHQEKEKKERRDGRQMFLLFKPFLLSFFQTTFTPSKTPEGERRGGYEGNLLLHTPFYVTPLLPSFVPKKKGKREKKGKGPGRKGGTSNTYSPLPNY